MSIKISGFSLTGGGGGGGGGGPEPQYGTAPTYNAIGLGTDASGIGMVQVSWVAPANSTSLFFVQTDKSAGTLDGYGNGWNQVNNVENNGNSWWDYIWLSSQENNSSASGIVDSNNFLGGNWIGIVESLIGVSAPPTLSNIVNNQSYGGNVSIVTNVSINDGELAVLVAGAEGHSYAGGNIVSVISNSGITWTRKCSRSNVESPSNNSSLFQTADIWYAINNTGNAISGDYVTITYADNYDDQSAIVSTWTGVNLNNPWA